MFALTQATSGPRISVGESRERGPTARSSRGFDRSWTRGVVHRGRGKRPHMPFSSNLKTGRRTNGLSHVQISLRRIKSPGGSISSRPGPSRAQIQHRGRAAAEPAARILTSGSFVARLGNAAPAKHWPGPQRRGAGFVQRTPDEHIPVSPLGPTRALTETCDGDMRDDANVTA